MKTLFLLVAILVIISLRAQINIIPQPVSIIQPKIAANFTITPATQIVLEGSNLENSSNFLNDYLQQFYHFKLKVVKNSTSNNAIRLNYERMDNSLAGAYQMTIDNKGIYIAGDNETGVFYSIQTLIQLLPISNPKSEISNQKLSIPYVIIKDYPRFSYRGMHLDVGRHFFPVSFVKKYIDYIALYKMNFFHWHLTEDQGWRIEIKKYPNLTKVGAWRNGTIIGRFPGTGNDGTRYGGYYTQDEIKDVVDYAAKRYITVIPEIEMPGHGSAAIASYPWLSCFPNEPTKKYFPRQCTWHGDTTGKQVQQTWGVFDDVFCAGKDSTFKFLEDVLDEVIALFPSKYIHVGGDECPKANWKRCPLCQKRIRDERLKDEHELQSYFIQRMEKYLNSKGRTLIGWDEILEGGLAPNAVVMSWRGEAGGIAAARQKHNVIMTPGGWVYFDHSQSQNEDSITIGGYTSVEKTYSYNPVPDSLTKDQSKYILGAQGNVWTEYMGNERKVEYMIFPRMSALSEVLWSQKKDSADFAKRLMTQFKRYDLWKANYSKAYFDLRTSVKPADVANANGILYLFSTKKKESPIYFDVDYLDGKQKAAVQIFTNEGRVFIDRTCVATLTLKSGDKILNSVTQSFYVNKATGKKITLTTPPSQNYPGDGAFTLINGVQNEKGLLRSKEVLGFSGDDLEAVIDLGSSQTIQNVIVHSLSSGGSWVFPPKYTEAFISADGKTFSSAGKSENFVATSNTNGTITVSFTPVTARFIKIFVKSVGIVPEGYRGAGNKAWLMVDEIEVN